MERTLGDFFNLVFFKVGANLKTEVSRYYLNYLWWIFEPLLTMAVFYIVFGVMLQRSTDNFVAFLLVGVTAWLWFNRSIMNSCQSILSARGIVSQTKITKVFFPLVVVVQDSVKQLVVVFLLILFLVLYGLPVGATWLALPVIMLVQLILIFGCAVMAAALIPFFPDLKFLVATGLQMMFFATGVFFDIDTVVSVNYRNWAYFNPMAGMLKNYRAVLLHGNWPDWQYLLWVTLFGVVLSILAVITIRRLDHTYPKVVL
jgi:lipopolysaccharide transport system permease protein